MNRTIEQHAKIRARAERALQDMYHNATPTYPRELYGRSDEYFQSWFEGVAEFEIEYLRDGGAYGRNYGETLRAPCNAGKFKSEAAQRYYVRKGMRDMQAERSDCGMLTGWRVLELAAGNRALARKLKKHGTMKRHNAMWECIGEYGKLYQYGRGGRTLAPDGLIHGRDAITQDYADKLSIVACVELIRVVESFNAYVESWCKGVPELWREHCECEDQAELQAKRERAQRKARETRERNYWAARDVITLAA